MVEKILVYERDLFFMLNGSDSPFLDRFMWLYSGKAVWLPLAFFILVVLLYKKKWRESILILLAIVLVITFCDQFASHVCKPIFTRFRPTHHPDFMDQVKTVFDYRGGRYGFISSHAANAFGFATFMSLLFRYRLFTWTIFLWAALTAYTRVYLGVHFISDIVPGAIAGVFFGWLVYWLYVKVRPVVTGTSSNACELYSTGQKRLIVYAIFIAVLIIAVFNVQLVACLR
ncbi:phosphatase PAP2 family protein [Parabacteroides segnis]|jgi:undecaprenyl-diphosphatase|uniref:Phosphatase PAP2 family protein n=1 Tax=Parabacteroides segnis TaxID=2763058 RepID=A0ABR7E4F5_9BACT|nr:MULTISPECIES: phosphatase PAP2 family protein [Parabacteroides]MBC5644642.1 phosphatase PAP2 family protein [Parabacteroides segnis]MCM0714113.1 phosphatase PAP2 family protein [Parabacteroides sp. TA-V-105]